MLSSDENPGLFTIVVALIALAFVGVGLTVVRDKRAKSGKGPSVMRLIAENNTEIGNLKEEIVAQQLHHERLVAKLAEDKVRMADIAREQEKIDAQCQSLTAHRDALNNAIDELEREYKALRNRPADPRPEPAAPAVAPPQPNPELLKARAAVQAAALRVSTISNQLAEAERNIAAGVVNVPGSLKTWKETAANLRKALIAAQAALDKARADLSAVAPGAPAMPTGP